MRLIEDNGLRASCVKSTDFTQLAYPPPLHASDGPSNIHSPLIPATSPALPLFAVITTELLQNTQPPPQLNERLSSSCRSRTSHPQCNVAEATAELYPGLRLYTASHCPH